MIYLRQITTLFILIASAASLSAQNNDSKKMEREIKISGNFYYGDGSGSNETDAKDIAIEELKLMISEYVRNNDPDVTEIDFRGFENNINTITIPMEGRVRVIAFMQKSEVTVNPAVEKRLIVIRLYPDEPALVGNANDVKEITPQPEIESDPIEPQPEVVALQAANIVFETRDQTINQLTKITSSKEVGEYLNENKSKGILMYGRLSTLQHPEKCYFVILKDGKLSDVLDRSSLSVRNALISGKQIDYRKVEDTIYWIYMIEN